MENVLASSFGLTFFGALGPRLEACIRIARYLNYHFIHSFQFLGCIGGKGAISLDLSPFLVALGRLSCDRQILHFPGESRQIRATGGVEN